MTTLRIVYDHPEDGVTVITPNPKARLDGESEVDFLRRVIAVNIAKAKQINTLGKMVNQHLAEGAVLKIVDVSEIPKMRGERNAWFRATHGAPRVL